jgi:hypothetical protein
VNADLSLAPDHTDWESDAPCDAQATTTDYAPADYDLGWSLGNILGLDWECDAEPSANATPEFARGFRQGFQDGRTTLHLERMEWSDRWDRETLRLRMLDDADTIEEYERAELRMATPVDSPIN